MFRVTIEQFGRVVFAQSMPTLGTVFFHAAQFTRLNAYRSWVNVYDTNGTLIAEWKVN